MLAPRLHFAKVLLRPLLQKIGLVQVWFMMEIVLHITIPPSLNFLRFSTFNVLYKQLHCVAFPLDENVNIAVTAFALYAERSFCYGKCLWNRLFYHC